MQLAGAGIVDPTSAVVASGVQLTASCHTLVVIN
jgi:hypothetical protein